MKILIVFRGDYKDVENPEFVCENIEKYIITPLKERQINYEINFSTYESNIEKLSIYKSKLTPNDVYYTNNGQFINFKESLFCIKDKYFNYDYVLFLRFDIIYKVTIADWDIFNKDGLIFPYKEDSEELFFSTNYYGDVIIGVSQNYFLNLYISLYKSDFEKREEFLHDIARIVKEFFPDTKINTIIEGYYQSNTRSPPISQDSPKLSPLYRHSISKGLIILN